jgi:hydrogenase maturation protein HypF
VAKTAQDLGAIEIKVTGIVQGVGFRPFVYKLAVSLGINGWVINTTAGVTVHLEGLPDSIDNFVETLKNNPPEMAAIDRFDVRETEREGFSSFFIYESCDEADTNISIPPDFGTCPDCLREFLDKHDRRSRYEFTNCVNCGPRFSITKSAPYDRVNTSMGRFVMCEKCKSEYTDPADRRFHAEPNACPVCGPKIEIKSSIDCNTESNDLPDGMVAGERSGVSVVLNGSGITDESAVEVDVNDDVNSMAAGATAIETARFLLKNGDILAVKGIGGYHLVCDATNAGAVKNLRERKRRHGKPFALMCRDLDTVRKYCELSINEEKILTSPARPILLLKQKSDIGCGGIASSIELSCERSGNNSSSIDSLGVKSLVDRGLDEESFDDHSANESNKESFDDHSLSEDIAPGLDTLGVMLPYTPLHYGLFDSELPVLVMTSANLSGDPLILDEDDAFRDLAGLADYFVIHNRQIINRADDSVVMSFNGSPYFIRRSRGYVPRSISLPGMRASHNNKLANAPIKTGKIFAAGGDLKSVFAFSNNDKVFPSQYFGDLDNLKNLEAYEDGVRFFSEFLKIEPEVVVCDLHPAYASTNFAERFAEKTGVPLLKVQHHKAHFASAMADNGLTGPAIGVVADGTGYGEDGAIWGFEFFYIDADRVDAGQRITRVASLEPFSQPRGDAIAKNPLHMAAILLYSMWNDKDRVLRALPEAASLMPFVKAQYLNKNLSIESSSCGRLFDAASAICGFREISTYEGEAPMRMESMAGRIGLKSCEPFNYEILTGPIGVSQKDMLQAMETLDVRQNLICSEDILRLSWNFLAEMAEEKEKGTDPVLLAARFHLTLSCSICDILEMLAGKYGTDNVVISGGTFQNRLLLDDIVRRLSSRSMVPYVHRQIPANDGGLALGQIMLASLLREA